MKKLKYMLFLGLMFLISMVGVSAAECTYGNTTIYIKCKTGSGNTAECSSNNVNFPMQYERLHNSVVENCNSSIYVSMQNGVITGLYGSKPTGKDVVEVKVMAKEDEEKVNTDLSAYNGRVCKYENVRYGGYDTNRMILTCTIKNGKPSCGIVCSKYDEDNKCEFYDYSSPSNGMLPTDFLSPSGVFDCPSNIYFCTQKSNSKLKITKYVGSNEECTGTFKYNGNIDEDTGHEGEFGDGNSGSIGGSGNSGEDGASSGEEFIAETFCQKEQVSATFRVIGWVFFILKILIPIVLIAFGCIDLSKAIISSKDDEIKKSVKTLVIRIIAGIIIFFIPSVLEFIVGLIGGENIYDKNSGSFGFCTSCMLDPTNDECGNLIGSS